MSEINIDEPIYIYLGKKAKKRIKALFDGGGKLAEEVSDTVAQVRAQLGDGGADKVILPVVVVYSKKRPRMVGRMKPWF